MKYLRWLLAWSLYLAGDTVSKILRAVPDTERWERPAFVLCAIYNRVMVWSHLVQGPGDFGPWWDAERTS